VTAAGGVTRDAAGRRLRGPNSTREVGAPCAAFNEGMRQALDVRETRAKRFPVDNHLSAAANYVRSDCELATQIFCRNLGVRFAHFDDERCPDLNALLTAAKHDSASYEARLAALKGLEAQ